MELTLRLGNGYFSPYQFFVVQILQTEGIPKTNSWTLVLSTRNLVSHFRQEIQLVMTFPDFESHVFLELLAGFVSSRCFLTTFFIQTVIFPSNLSDYQLFAPKVMDPVFFKLRADSFDSSRPHVSPNLPPESLLNTSFFHFSFLWGHSLWNSFLRLWHPQTLGQKCFKFSVLNCNQCSNLFQNQNCSTNHSNRCLIRQTLLCNKVICFGDLLAITAVKSSPENAFSDIFFGFQKYNPQNCLLSYFERGHYQQLFKEGSFLKLHSF